LWNFSPATIDDGLHLYLSIGHDWQYCFSRFVFSFCFLAHQKTVGGMKYDLVVSVVKEKQCLGAFKVITEDKGGKMKNILRWGEEVNCREVIAIGEEYMRRKKIEEAKQKKNINAAKK